MTLKPLILNQGGEDEDTQIRSGKGAEPEAVYVASPDTETVGELAERLYGYDTPASRDRINRANTSTNGIVRIPLS